MLKRQMCMFRHFPLVQSMRNCSLFFWPFQVGQAQSGFNHKTPWPHARWSEANSWYICNVHINTSAAAQQKQKLACYAAGRDTLTRVQLQVEALSRRTRSERARGGAFTYLERVELVIRVVQLVQ